MEKNKKLPLAATKKMNKTLGLGLGLGLGIPAVIGSVTAVTIVSVQKEVRNLDLDVTKIPTSLLPNTGAQEYDIKLSDNGVEKSIQSCTVKSNNPTAIKASWENNKVVIDPVGLGNANVSIDAYDDHGNIGKSLVTITVQSVPYVYQPINVDITSIKPNIDPEDPIQRYEISAKLQYGKVIDLTKAKVEVISSDPNAVEAKWDNITDPQNPRVTIQPKSTFGSAGIFVTVTDEDGNLGSSTTIVSIVKPPVKQTLIVNASAIPSAIPATFQPTAYTISALLPETGDYVDLTDPKNKVDVVSSNDTVISAQFIDQQTDPDFTKVKVTRNATSGTATLTIKVTTDYGDVGAAFVPITIDNQSLIINASGIPSSISASSFTTQSYAISATTPDGSPVALTGEKKAAVVVNSSDEDVITATWDDQTDPNNPKVKITRTPDTGTVGKYSNVTIAMTDVNGNKGFVTVPVDLQNKNLTIDTSKMPSSVSATFGNDDQGNPQPVPYEIAITRPDGSTVAWTDLQSISANSTEESVLTAQWNSTDHTIDLTRVGTSGTTNIVIDAIENNGNRGTAVVPITIKNETLYVNAASIPSAIDPKQEPITCKIEVFKPDGSEISQDQLTDKTVFVESSNPNAIEATWDNGTEAGHTKGVYLNRLTESGSTTIYVVAHDKEGNYGATTVSVVIQAQTLTVNATAIPASIPPTFSPTTYPIIAAKPDGTEIDVTEIESSKTVISSSDPTIIKVERAADADNRLQVIVTRLAERGSANLYFFIVDKNGDAGTATITVRIQEDSILAYANQLPTSIGTDFSIANYPVSATSPGGDTIDITTCTVTVSSNDPNTIAVSVVNDVAKTDPDYNKIKIERKAQVGGVYVTLKIVDSIGRVGTATTIISIQNSSLIIDPSNIPTTLSPVDTTDDYYYTISVARPEGIAVDLTDSRTQVDVNSSAPTIIDADWDNQTDPNNPKVKITRKATTGTANITIAVVDYLGNHGMVSIPITIQNQTLIVDASKLPTTLYSGSGATAPYQITALLPDGSATTIANNGLVVTSEDPNIVKATVVNNEIVLEPIATTGSAGITINVTDEHGNKGGTQVRVTIENQKLQVVTSDIPRTIKAPTPSETLDFTDYDISAKLGDNTVTITDVSFVNSSDDVINVRKTTSGSDYKIGIKPLKAGMSDILLTVKDANGNIGTTIVSVQVTNDLILPTSYESLKNLISTQSLIAGQQYRITNYQATVDSDTYANKAQAATNQYGFDIIVTAVNNYTLNENAIVMENADFDYSTTTKANFSAWNVKYCFSNDTSRFDWAADDGKGVIYYMQDEFGNEAPYDFKNIQFKPYGETYTDTHYCYTFASAYVANNTDLSLDGNVNKVYSNVISAYKPTASTIQSLNGIVMFGNNSHSNKFGENCREMTFGSGCYSNTFADSCYKNTFGKTCYSNKFGDLFTNNKIGNWFLYNTFDQFCSGNNIINTSDNTCQFSNFFGSYTKNLVINADASTPGLTFAKNILWSTSNVTYNTVSIEGKIIVNGQEL